MARRRSVDGSLARCGKVVVVGCPSSDLTTSDRGEPDDFVQSQLLLSTAIEGFFAVDRSDCRTVFRDDLLGVALFVAPEGAVMQALCRRPAPHGQWMLVDLGPAPRWSAYKDATDLGVLVTAEAPPGEAGLDPDRRALLRGLAYTMSWDIPAPEGPP